MKIKSDNPQDLAVRAFYLAYEACGSTQGMGMLQARESVTESQIRENVVNNGDYPIQLGKSPNVRMYGDYVFGRMMKLRIIVQDDGVEVPDDMPRLDYQAWSAKYGTYEDLIEAAKLSLASDDN